MDYSHQPITIDDWKGLYARGVGDTTPTGYFQDCLNVIFAESDVMTRYGSVKSLNQSNIVRFFMYKRLGETPRIIYLDNVGNLYDSLYPSVPIYTDASFIDFSMATINNRAYITPHNRVTGIAGKSVLVYDGSGSIARPAAGTAPTGFVLGAANSATSGTIEAGIHLLAVCFETASGFITAPGPSVFAQVNAPGGKSIDITNIPIGPAGTVARRIIMSGAVPASLFTGNQFGYSLYFVPNNGRIADNTTTSLTISNYDAALVADATYTLNNLSSIPAGLGIGFYNNKMITWGEQANQHTVRVSSINNNEAFDSANGFFTTDPSENASGVKNCFDYRGNLYILKSGGTFSTQDNSSSPSTWNVISIDKGVGTECFGVNTVLDKRGTSSDRVWVADRSGLLNFEGFFKKPELTWLVEDIWRKRINFNVFNLVQVVLDPTLSAIYVALPLDGSATLSHILYGDYGNAIIPPYGYIDSKEIKWSLWTLPAGLASIVVDADTATGNSMFKFAATGGIFDVKSTLTNDDGNAFVSFVQTALYTAKVGWINHFGVIVTRMLGTGTLVTSLTGEDGSNGVTLPTTTMSSSPGKEMTQLCNFVNERCSVKFLTGNNVNELFKLTRMDLLAKYLWKTRPA